MSQLEKPGTAHCGRVRLEKAQEAGNAPRLLRLCSV